MTVDAAELLAQVIAGLLIALVLEGRTFSGKLDGVMSRLVAAEASSERTKRIVELKHAITEVAMWLFLTTTLTAVALSLCLMSVISDRPMPRNAALVIAVIVGVMLLFVVLMPAMFTQRELWRRANFDEMPMPKWIRIAVRVFCFAVFAACLLVLMLSVPGVISDR